jgi:AcrR family transcriptional regulator
MKRSKSEKALLAAGKKLFWKHGMRRVSVEEVCEEAGVSKMTFYRKFPHKYDLTMQLLEEMISRSLENYNETMQSDLEYSQKILKIIENKQKEAKEISMELVKDIYSGGDDYKELRSFMEQHQVQFMERLRKDFTLAQNQGHIRSELKVDFIIHILHSMSRLTEDAILLGMYDDLSDLSRDLTNVFFYGITKR